MIFVETFKIKDQKAKEAVSGAASAPRDARVLS